MFINCCIAFTEISQIPLL